MAHELSNLLFSVVANAQLCLRRTGKDDTFLSQRLEEIIAAAGEAVDKAKQLEHWRPDEQHTAPLFSEITTRDRGQIPRAHRQEKADKRGHVLFIDDESFVIEAISLGLEDLGYTVTACRDGVEAVGCFRSSPLSFDIVFTDLTMPNTSGLQIARELKQIRAEVPIVLISGDHSGLSEEEFHTSGIDECVLKPIGLKEFVRIIERLAHRNE